MITIFFQILGVVLVYLLLFIMVDEYRKHREQKRDMEMWQYVCRLTSFQTLVAIPSDEYVFMEVEYYDDNDIKCKVRSPDTHEFKCKFLISIKGGHIKVIK